MFGAHPWELLVVLFIALLLFGKRLPGLMGSFGKSIVEFKRGIKGVDDESEQSEEPAERPPVEAGKPSQA